MIKGRVEGGWNQPSSDLDRNGQLVSTSSSMMAYKKNLAESGFMNGRILKGDGLFPHRITFFHNRMFVEHLSISFLKIHWSTLVHRWVFCFPGYIVMLGSFFLKKNTIKFHSYFRNTSAKMENRAWTSDFIQFRKWIHSTPSFPRQAEK